MSTLTLEERLERLERIVASGEVNMKAKAMCEDDVIVAYRVSKSTLKRMRNGYTKDGEFISPKLFKWSSRNGRDIIYDVAELNKVFERTPATPYADKHAA